MKTRTVKQTLYGHIVDMGGNPVRQPIPTRQTEQIDPFLLFHHGTFSVSAGTSPLHAGVGPHPHRGFSPLTVVISGEVHHRDSLGNSSVIGPDGIQWVHAGRGIVHSERPSAELAAKGGYMELIQLWINTPATHKMRAAAYEALEGADMPVFSPGPGARVWAIAGGNGQIESTLKGDSELFIARLKFVAGASAFIQVPDSFELGIYLISGQAKVQGFGVVEEHNLIHFNPDGQGVELSTNDGFDALLISGKPIQEPLATYGPFVMNTQTQILEAMRDYQTGKMGILIEEKETTL